MLMLRPSAVSDCEPKTVFPVGEWDASDSDWGKHAASEIQVTRKQGELNINVCHLVLFS